MATLGRTCNNFDHHGRQTAIPRLAGSIISPMATRAAAAAGPMTAETRTERLKIYANYARNLNPAQSGKMPRFIKGPDPMIRLAEGPAHDQTDYTEAVMGAWKQSAPRDRPFDALSSHYDTPGPKGSMLVKQGVFTQ
jgi:hypothetical protein